MNVVCLGDCGIDDYVTTGDRLPGGITLNFALQARRAFRDDDAIKVVSALGTDQAANVVRGALEAGGVDFDITTLDGDTPVQRIALGPDGERHFAGWDAGVLEKFRPSAMQRRTIADADWLVMPHFVQVRALFDAVLQLPRSGALAVDFADFREHRDFALLERSLEQVDVVFFGLDAGDSELLGPIERLARERDRLLVVTLGSAGSVAYDGRRAHRQAAIPVPAVVDTTGAGDAFAAGFLSRHCHHAAVPDSLEAGARCAATVIQQLGGNCANNGPAVS
jgi:fructoselysine 6-kinase